MIALVCRRNQIIAALATLTLAALSARWLLAPARLDRFAAWLKMPIGPMVEAPNA